MDENNDEVAKLTVDNSLKKFRVREDLTQAELARELDVSRQTINAIETGRYNPSLELALEIARFFNAQMEEIFELEDQQ